MGNTSACMIPIGGTVDRNTGEITIRYRECTAAEREAYIEMMLQMHIRQAHTTTSEESMCGTSI